MISKAVLDDDVTKGDVAPNQTKVLCFLETALERGELVGPCWNTIRSFPATCSTTRPAAYSL